MPAIFLPNDVKQGPLYGCWSDDGKSVLVTSFTWNTDEVEQVGSLEGALLDIPGLEGPVTITIYPWKDFISILALAGIIDDSIRVEVPLFKRFQKFVSNNERTFRVSPSDALNCLLYTLKRDTIMYIIDVVAILPLVFYIGPYAEFSLSAFKDLVRVLTVDSINKAVAWLMGWPAGFKLNAPLDRFLGEMFLWMNGLWSGTIDGLLIYF